MVDQAEVILRMVSNTVVHLLLLETRTETKQTVNFCFKTDKFLLSGHWCSLKNEYDGLFSSFRDHFCGQIHEIMGEFFLLRMSVL